MASSLTCAGPITESADRRGRHRSRQWSAGQNQTGDLTRRRARRLDRPGRVGGRRPAHCATRGPNAKPLCAKAATIRGQRRVEALMDRRMVADDVDDGRARLRALCRLARPLPRPGPKWSRVAAGLSRHAGIAIRSPCHDPLEKPKDRTHAGHPVEGAHEMHLRGAGIGKADVDAAVHERAHQALGAVHAGASGMPVMPFGAVSKASEISI